MKESTVNIELFLRLFFCIRSYVCGVHHIADKNKEDFLLLDNNKEQYANDVFSFCCRCFLENFAIFSYKTSLPDELVDCVLLLSFLFCLFGTGAIPVSLFRACEIIRRVCVCVFKGPQQKQNNLFYVLFSPLWIKIINK